MTARGSICAVAGAVCLAALVICGGCGSAAAGTTSTRPAGTGATDAHAAPARVRGRAPVRRTPDPGTLPQTDARPGTGRALQAQLRTLWVAIVTGSTRVGRSVFFPESAYRQVKAIPDPSADYSERLLAQFDLDLGAYRAHLGRRPASSRLVDVEVDAALAQWIPPGVCENAVGYWHLPGVRMVYATDARR